MEREVRYCTSSDGTKIAYCVEGEGPAVIVPAFWLESFSTQSMLPELDAFMRRLGEGRTLVQWDARNVGLSERGVPFPSGPVPIDLEAIIEAAGLDTFSVCGMEGGGWYAIDAAVRWPGRVDRIVLAETFPTARLVMPSDQLESMATFARTNWALASQMYADLTTRSQYAEEARVLAAMFTKSVDGATAAEANLWGYEHIDLQDKLVAIQCPTLVVHRRDDQFYPFAIAQEMARAIPGARLVPLDGDVCHLFLGDSAAVLDAIDGFLPKEQRTTAESAVPAPSSFRTILFTDLVGHTEMMSRLGDERGRAVLREHEAITRNVLKDHGGTEVKTMGDGFMASFASVTRAVECAIALQRAFTAHEGEPLYVRVGLNAGEPIEEDGDLFGATVILASRIAAKADAGEILVADTVRGLCSGKGFLFADRGDFVAKGFEEPVRIFEVRWQG